MTELSVAMMLVIASVMYILHYRLEFVLKKMADLIISTIFYKYHHNNTNNSILNMLLKPHISLI